MPVRRIVMGALAAFSFAASAAADDLAGSSWNMTPEQVLAAVPAATEIKRGARRDSMTLATRAPIEVAGLKLNAEYYYDSRGLARVRVSVPFAKCQAVGNDQLHRRGQPVRVSDQVILRLFIWHETQSETRVRLLFSTAGICDLFYERLADYREHDLQPG